MNPALGGRCFLLIAFAADMTNFNVTRNGVDVYSGATPLALIKNEGLSSVNVRDMLIGNTAGTIGETSVIAILIGAIIMILLGVIDLKIPASYIITLLFSCSFSEHSSLISTMLLQSSAVAD